MAMPDALQNALSVMVGTLPLCGGLIFWAAFQQSQRLSRLESHMDMLTSRTNSQFDMLTARFNSQFDSLTERTNSQYDSLNSKIDKLIAQGAEHNTRLTVLESKIDGRLVEAR